MAFSNTKESKEAEGLDVEQTISYISTEATQDDKDDCLYYFALTNKTHSFLNKSLLMQHENGDCRLLCRMLGIYSKDNLKSTIDKNHKYYDSKTKEFTMFRSVSTDIDIFLVFIHWLRFGTINNIIDSFSTFKKKIYIFDGLQRICALLGTDGLYKELNYIKKKLDKEKNDSYNPLEPCQDTLKKYIWQCLHIPNDNAPTMVSRDFQHKLSSMVGPNTYSHTLLDKDKRVVWARAPKVDKLNKTKQHVVE